MLEVGELSDEKTATKQILVACAELDNVIAANIPAKNILTGFLSVRLEDSSYPTLALLTSTLNWRPAYPKGRFDWRYFTEFDEQIIRKSIRPFCRFTSYKPLLSGW
jgi:hypothetical protein